MKQVKYYYHHRSGKLSHHSNKLSLLLTFLGIPIVVILFLSLDIFLDNLKFEMSFSKLLSLYHQIPFLLLLKASLFSVLRITIAYFASFIVALGLSLLVTSNKTINKFLLPIYDVLESIPILAFFPFLIIFFIRHNFVEGAAMFIIFLAILWNLVFTMVGGIQLIPEEIKSSSKLYSIKGFKYLKNVLLPAITPEIVTGSILAIAAAWDILIVAEVLHTYIPNSNPNIDLFGLGSLFVNASNAGNSLIFTSSLFCMIIIITLTNIFIWQKLLRYSEKFRFE